MKFLSVTHTAHKIQDIAFHDSDTEGLKYLADYIYSNLDAEDKALAREADEPLNVSMDIEGNGTKNVFCWRTSVLKDEKPNEGIALRWRADKGVENAVVSFLVEIPEDSKYLVFPMGFSENFDLVTVSVDPYQNFAFYNDFLTAQNNATQMYAGINRKMKKDHSSDSVTGTFYEEYSTREIGFDGLQQWYTRVEILDLNAAISEEKTDDATTEQVDATPAQPVTPAPVSTQTNSPATPPANTKKLVPPTPTPVVPIAAGQKITTDYLKNWIENVIVNSKIFNGNYAVTITRDYKNSSIKCYTQGNSVSFKGLVDAKKYPSKVDYRGFTIKIDVGNITVYEGKIHIISSDTLIVGVGVEPTASQTADTVFGNIFTNATTNDPKAAGVSKGSFAKMPVTACVFIQTVDKTKKRSITTTLLPSEVISLKDYFEDATKGLPERVEFELNSKFGMEWVEVASVVGAMFITIDAKIETVGVVDLPNTQPQNTTTQSVTTSTPAVAAQTTTQTVAPITLPQNPTLADVAKVLELSYADQEWNSGYAMTVVGFAGNVKKANSRTFQAFKDGLISEVVEFAAYRQGDYKNESTQKFQDLYNNIPDCWEVKVKTQPQNGGAKFWTLQILVENTTREVIGYTYMNGCNSTKLTITPITNFVPNGLGNSQKLTVTANSTQTQSTGTVNALIEILDIHNPVKNVIGHVNMTLTLQDLQELEDAYTSSRIDEETVVDRLFNSNIQDEIDKQFPNVDWDLGDTTITYPNNSTKKLLNHWM